MLGFFGWRGWDARRKAVASHDLFDMDLDSPAESASPLDSHVMERSAQHAVEAKATTVSEHEPNLGRWGEEADMDVVQPETVAEEVQLLLDHGMTRQAIELLQEEIVLRPQALVLWLKLFEAYRQDGDCKQFAVYAQNFRAQFLSESLWRQVQAIGRDLDPTNLLYRVEEALTPDELAIHLPAGELPSGNDDFDFPSLAQPAATPSDIKNGSAEAHLDLPLEFHFTEIDSEPIEFCDASVPLVATPCEPMFSIEAPVLNLPEFETSSPKAFSPEDFVSDDVLMQDDCSYGFCGAA